MMNPSSEPEPKAPFFFPSQGAAASQPQPYTYYPEPMAYPGATEDQPQPCGQPPPVTYYVPPQAVNHCPPKAKPASSCKSKDKCEGPQAQFKCAYCDQLFMHRMKKGTIKCTHCDKTNIYGNSRVKGFASLIFSIIMVVTSIITTPLILIGGRDYNGDIEASTYWVLGGMYLLTLSGILWTFIYFCSKKAQLISTPQAIGECSA